MQCYQHIHASPHEQPQGRIKIQICHPFNTPGSDKLHVPIDLASPQLRKKHFPVSGCTTVPPVCQRTAEVGEDRPIQFPHPLFLKIRVPTQNWTPIPLYITPPPSHMCSISAGN